MANIGPAGHFKHLRSGLIHLLPLVCNLQRYHTLVFRLASFNGDYVAAPKPPDGSPFRQLVDFALSFCRDDTHKGFRASRSLPTRRQLATKTRALGLGRCG